MIYGLLNRLALACAAAGLAISTVLTIAHASSIVLPCGGSNGCEEVARDPLSMFMGVPISVFGMAAYLVLIAAGAMRIMGVALRLSSFVGLIVSMLGTIISALLTYHSIAQIHATCLWCLSSALMLTLSLIAYIATPEASKGIKDRWKPISSLPWAIVPPLAVAAVAMLGGAAKPPPTDLSSVLYKNASLAKLAETSRALGQKTAPVTIVEFADFMCPACKEMHQKLMLFLIHNKGKVRLMYHPFPLANLEGHELSEFAAEQSEQLNLDDFWAYVSKVYGSEQKPAQADLDRIVGALSGKRLRTADEAKAAVAEDIKIGKEYGVTETPTYILFIDGKPAAVASSDSLQNVIKRPEFANVFRPAAQPR